MCLTLCDPMDCSMPSFPVHHQLPELAQTHFHKVSEAIQPSHPLLSPSPPPSIFPSIRVFSNESVLHIRWSKYWSFSVSPSIEYSGLIFFRIDWFDLLAVQEIPRSLLQHCSSKALILQCSAFFMAFLYTLSDINLVHSDLPGSCQNLSLNTPMFQWPSYINLFQMLSSPNMLFI